MSDCPGCAEWREKHYPIEAKDCPEEQAFDHVFAKWEGVARLLEGPIGEVRLSTVNNSFISCAQCGQGWGINTITCALCRWYLRRDERPRCAACPIYIQTGQDCDSEYKEFIFHHDAAPMLALLRRVKEAGK